MKKKKYLPLYRKWVKTGRLPHRGLCHSLNDGNRMGKIFKPEWATSFWAANDMYEDIDVIAWKFNPLRQNIVLLMAAMNGEL